ncbi:hypothetical protein HDU92_007221 [Lobulomyces angularis]|nr:hypothetical protein HDU92_007221 [Lobulomyces angularis]
MSFVLNIGEKLHTRIVSNAFRDELIDYYFPENKDKIDDTLECSKLFKPAVVNDCINKLDKSDIIILKYFRSIINQFLNLATSVKERSEFANGIAVVLPICNKYDVTNNINLTSYFAKNSETTLTEGVTFKTVSILDKKAATSTAVKWVRVILLMILPPYAVSQNVVG